MIFFRPNALSDFQSFVSIQHQIAVFVPNAEVAWADYQAIKRDFPSLHSLSETEIDTWIIKNFSFISKYQLDLGELRNSKINFGTEEIKAYRQCNFGSKHQEFQGRGDIIIARDPQTNQEIGLVDRKGVGVSYTKKLENSEILEELKREGDENKKIQTRNLSSGLMYLGEAFIEAASLKVTQKVFDILNAEKIYDQPFPPISPFSEAPLQTIEGYFVIKLPFNVHAGEHGTQPAAIYGRQAHVGRVWTGKIYTKYVNIKQADFFLALCDGGTVRIRLPELIESSKLIEGGPVLLQYEVGLELVKKYLSGDKKILEATIEKVLAPAAKRIENADKIANNPPILKNAEEAFIQTVKLIETDPERFCRFSELIWYVAKYDPNLLEKCRPAVEKIVRHYLSLSKKVKDIDGSNKPMRRWGLLLLSTLPFGERLEALKYERKKFLVEPEFLGRSAILFTFDELKGEINSIYAKSGGWMKVEVDSLLMDPHLANDSRQREWNKIREWIKYQKSPLPPIPLKTQKEILIHKLRKIFS